MAYFLKVVTIIAISATLSAADNLGTYGHVYPVIEKDLLVYLKEQIEELPAEKLSPIISNIKTSLHQSVLTSKSIPKSTVSNTFYYDPAWKCDRDILDDQGKVIIKKGTTINPLDTLQLTSSLLFFDGTDLEQVEWANKQTENDKWVLTHGDPFDLEKKHQRPIYFDQHYSLVQKLGIKHVPSRVKQEGTRLKVEEIALSQKADL